MAEKAKIHFSIDDFFTAFAGLTDNREQYSSLFAQPAFAFFKRLHEAYQAVFSCFCFYEDLKSGMTLAHMTDCFMEEFQANADWLRFGFHGLNSEANYGSTRFLTGSCRTDYLQAGEDYEKTIRELERVTGGIRAIDRVPRIHFYAGTVEVCRAWAGSRAGIRGLLSAEDKELLVFTHEPFLAEERIREMFQSCAAFAKERGYVSGFPEDWLQEK